jgi:MoxR-like ATPase
MGYPDFASQVSILRDRHSANPLEKIQPIVTVDGLQQLIAQAAQMEVVDSIYEYVTHLTQATRAHPMVALGISPRGALAVCRMAKARAFVLGRDYTIPEDVAAVFCDVCAHRLVLSTKARMMEERAENILRAILDSVNMPVLRQ